jgi:hypothetical protein
MKSERSTKWHVDRFVDEVEDSRGEIVNLNLNRYER